jgi:outer membrane protein assembly factor BamA
MKAADNYNFSIMPIPVIYYTPDTAWGYGAAALFTGNYESISLTVKPDTAVFSIVYTEKKQLQFDLITENFLDSGGWYLNMEPIYSYYPSTIWGLGPGSPASASESFIYTEQGVTISLLRTAAPGILAGLYYKFNNYYTSDLKPGGMLEQGLIDGARGGRMSAPGLRFVYDDRDRRFSPTRGIVVDLKAAMSLKTLSASSNFYEFDGEAKYFHTLFPDNILCLDAILRQSGKGAPMRFMQRLGGLYYMRGYYEGRYLDYAYTALAAEYRFPIMPSLRGDIFGEAGQVADDITRFTTNSIKGAWGFGLHWKPFDFMESPLRFELTFARGDMELYMDIQEAF